VPVHNEEGNIALFVEKLSRAYASCGVSGEILFVDDGSTDGTYRAVEAAATDRDFVRAVRHPCNYGLTECLKTGLRNTTGEILRLLPADLESDPEEDVPKLLAELDRGYDVVAGWRQDRKDGKVMSSVVYNLVSRVLFRVPAHDMNWVKALRRKVLNGIHLRSDWHRFLLPLIAARGYSIGEVKTNWYPRRHGKSKFGFSRALVSVFDLLALKFILAFTKKPMVFFGTIGSALMLAGVLMMAYLIYIYVAQAIQIRPFVLMAVLLILSGLILVMLGFLSELVVEGHQRLDSIEERLRGLLRRDNPER
jgi:glycosyltransferase involved in cell wall biosynthesis